MLAACRLAGASAVYRMGGAQAIAALAYGTETVAAFRALSLVSDATWSLPGALGDASEIVLGQRIGARDYAGARAFRRDATRIAVTVCASEPVCTGTVV